MDALLRTPAGRSRTIRKAASVPESQPTAMGINTRKGMGMERNTQSTIVATKINRTTAAARTARLAVGVIGLMGLMPSVALAVGLRLNWTDNANNEDGVKIERKLGTAGAYAEIGQVGVNIETYTDNNLAFSQQFCYRVRAFNAAGNSAYSNEACGTTGANPLPATPAGVTVTPLP